MDKLNLFLRRRFQLLYRLLLVCAAVLYGILSCNRVVWGDEAYTFALIGHSFGQIWQITAADVHPPLYYFLLKLLTAPFHSGLYAARAVSALPCIVLSAVGGWQIRKLFDEKTALLWMLLYLAFPFTMDHAAEIRMYSLAQLLVSLNALWAVKSYRENTVKNWLLFALFGTAAAYTHYFALVSAGIIYGILMFALLLHKKPMKGWLLASVITIVLYLPWLGSFLSQLAYKVSNEYWIPPITGATFVSYAAELFGTGPVESFFCLALAAFVPALTLLCLNPKRRVLGLCALAVPLGTAALGIAVSVLMRPIFIIRYILPSTPILLFCFCYGIVGFKKRFVSLLLALVLLFGGALNFLSLGKNALRTPNYSLSNAFVAQYPEAQAYVVWSGSTGLASQSLAYYAPDKNVYSPDVLASGNPFANWLDIAQFPQEAIDRLILFTGIGETVPEAFAGYQAVYLKNFDIYGAGISAWYLTR